MASDLSEDEWLTALPQALNTGFVRTNENFRNQGQPSGTTVTFVVVQGWTVTIASVGDSRCILVSQGNEVSTLTVDHRFESNEEERDRVIKKGIDLCRLRIPDGSEVGPLRCFPGGLCLSRSIGDFDVGDFILPIPHVKQIKLSRAGGRFIIASDGVWDSISCEKAAKCCRGLSPKDAAWKIVRTSVKKRGLRDDTTCLVVDVTPSYSNLQSVFWATSETKGNLNSCFPWWKSKDSSANVATIPSSPSIEELFEYDSVRHLEQLSSDPSSYTFICALCETKISLNDLITVHAGSFFSMHNRALEGSFFCRSCKPTENSNVGEY
ncbi:hypothetical protein KP509_28G022800 [Ceratopteris richardii]|nr:hypothetical protein KP509_28G022800 [Ceratopteris richardii]